MNKIEFVLQNGGNFTTLLLPYEGKKEDFINEMEESFHDYSNDSHFEFNNIDMIIPGNPNPIRVTKYYLNKEDLRKSNHIWV